MMRDQVEGENGATPGMERQIARRRRSATAGSLAIHALLALLAFTLLRGDADEPRPAPRVDVVDIELGPRPERPQLLAAIGPGTPGTPAPARSAVSSGLRGRHGHPVASPVKAPPATDPFAELSVAYETGDPGASRPGPGTGADGNGPGLGLAGAGLGNGNGGGMRVPAAPPSLARPARPKHDYSRWSYRPPGQYGDTRVFLELTIDARGRVSGVRVLESVDRHIDERATAYARTFEFHSALDDRGEPTSGVYRWEFIIEGQVDFASALQR